MLNSQLLLFRIVVLRNGKTVGNIYAFNVFCAKKKTYRKGCEYCIIVTAFLIVQRKPIFLITQTPSSRCVA